MVTIEEIIVSLRVQTSNAMKKLDGVNKLTKKNGELNVNARKNLDNYNKSFNSLTSQIQKTQRPFAGWAMSIMFAGRALQRGFTSIWKSSTKTFNEVMHSVEGTSTGFDMLEGSMKFLGFTIGSALEPIAMKLIPIIDMMSEWVSQHPQLTAGVLSVVGILGTLAFVGGSVKLAVDGIVSAFNLFKIKGITAISGVKSSFLNLKTMIGGGLLLYVGYQLFKNGTKDTPASTSDWIKNLGLASIGGYMVGGPYGALAAFLISGVIMIAEESIKKALKTVEEFRDAQDKLMKGEFLTAEEAFRVGFSGTVATDTVQYGMQRTFEDAFSSVLDSLRASIPQPTYTPETSGGFTGGTIVIQNAQFTAGSESELYKELNRTVIGG
jgi:hypothetical protein